MASVAPIDTKYHVLLVGVDNYKTSPLAGCVNDIDIVQRTLLDKRMGLPADRIRRLASPIAGTVHDTAVAEQPATLANIRAALAELGSDKVADGDRVFIYYSGHGASVKVESPDGRESRRESIVPADYGLQADVTLLYDYEINDLLRAIVARTRSVTIVLDCCFAAGATRSSGQRYIDIDATLPDLAPGGRSEASAPRAVGALDDCHVVSACMNHEVAREEVRDGKKHGLLTRAFIDTLEAATEADRPKVTWARIWQAMQAHIKKQNPWQNPWMAGNPGRAVFAGPPVSGNPGIPVSRTGDEYCISAGELAGITPGAVLAIYGDTPPEFAPLDSKEDREARKGLVRVTDAKDATATAVAVGTLFELPPEARGRLVKAGAETRLRCAVVPSNPTLERHLAKSRLLALDAPSAQVKLEYHDGRWFVTDDFHGTAPPKPVLFSLAPDQLDAARAVLEHYHAYARPQSIATLTKDKPRALELSVRVCQQREISTRDAQVVDLPPASSTSRGTFELEAGALVCFQVRNHSKRPMQVTLVNAAASGKVQLLGDQVIESQQSYVFWARNNLGHAFHMSLPRGVSHCIDRLVAIGRTELNHDLKFLRVDQTFTEVAERRRGDKLGDKLIEDGSEPRRVDEDVVGDYWTTAEVVIETRA